MEQHAQHRPLVRLSVTRRAIGKPSLPSPRFATPVFALTVALVGAPLWGQEACRQALAFGLDVSGSVDSREYRQQVQGLSMALRHPDVQDALLAMPSSPVTLAVFEWSGPMDQSMLIPWTRITDGIALENFASALQTMTRRPAEQSTALGQALIFGAGLLAQRPGCWTRTLDISGDGKSNTGVQPQDIGPEALGDITVNALVIGADPLDHGDQRQAEISDLSAYFRAYVIRRPGSFVEVALGFDDYEAAMVRKLKRELSGFALSSNSQTTKPAASTP